MEWVTNPEAWIALATLTGLEIVLGIDNIIFITILSGRLPPHQRSRARTLGLMGAMITRILLLCTLSWMMKLTAPLFVVWGNSISGRDLILIVGGLFLLGKSTFEIHAELEGHESGGRSDRPAKSFVGIITQIMLLDIVFSLDSVITAIGMADLLVVMILAVVISVVVMVVAAKPIGTFVERRPTIKMLALSFLLLIGVALIADGLDLHIPKGYIYFAMAFSMFVEILNLKLLARQGTTQRPV